mmetsp:Transcript_3066/g.1791  ORF Transcript_3066/g.1791 Transcript_3066/m.1791 type:complete len:150 (+) Transcript_3066:7751-8200(+)
MDLSFESIKGFVEKPFAFVEQIGLRAIELKPRYVKLAVPLKGNENHIGTMYAGALFVLGEVPGGALYLTTFDVSRFYPVIKKVSIKFLKPAKTDVTVEFSISVQEVERISSEAEKKGKAEFTIEDELKDSFGEVVAEFCGVYQLRTIGN